MTAYKRGRARKNRRLSLETVTLVSVTGISPAKNIRALQISRVDIEFGDVLLLTRKVPTRLPPGIQCREIKQDSWSYNEFSRFMLFELFKYVNTQYALFVHDKAFVLRPQSWSKEFLEYDYIGAPWQPNAHFTNSGSEVRVGNGGFSLRSQKIMRAPTELSLPFTDNGTGYFHEDGQLCVYHRDQLENYGVKFAPVELAARFSTESWIEGAVVQSFGFHNNRSAKPFLFSQVNWFRRTFR